MRGGFRRRNGLAQEEYDSFALGPHSSCCLRERQLRAGKMLWQGWSGRFLDLDGWATARAADGGEGRRGAAEHRREGSFCLEECGAIRSLQCGLCQALCRKLELYEWVDRKTGQQGSLPRSSHVLSA